MQKITPRQIVLLGVTYVINLTMVNIPSQIVNRASQHGYLSYLLAGALVLLMLFFLTRSSYRFPGKDLFQSLTARFPFIGRAIVLLYILFFFMILVRDIRIMTDFTNVILLPVTPILMISLCISATVIYIARGGARTVLGITELYGPIMIIVVLIMPVIALRDLDFNLMKPFFYVNWKGVTEGGWLSVSYLGQLLVLPFIFSSKDYKFKYGLYSMLIALGVLTILILMAIMLLGVPVSGRMMYPSYELVRQMRVTDFLDRFDLIVVALWYPAVLLNIAISLYIVCYGLKNVIPTVSGKMMAAPLGLFAYSCAFWFYQNSIELFEFNRQWTVIALFFIVVLPLLIFAIHRPSKARIE
ncbi:endospore germination permease [Paenibacillus sp. HJL G12]|uniref:Endospore germination permease n=1 Tax=Paenibacillus dendrobii TaxID=2691084 RepID=A0A7X3IN50_9BACL|nr:endospore germination permease [Paenibacillus dendrobii]